jgi:glycine cleavage system regulatory protein
MSSTLARQLASRAGQIMRTHLVLTVIGPDRPGLVSVLSDTIAAGGGNWLDSRMASLAGQFAGILLLDVESHRADELRAALQQLDGSGLRLVVEQSPVDAAAANNGRVLKLELVGHDRPGIVRDISRVLAENQVSIADFHTDRSSASFSGESMFKATALLYLPTRLDVNALKRALESLANELMVDLDIEDR